ncbi:MAG: hypothetical protein OXF03_07545 [Gammaproteobacteria bacterium]|nr:hypothetical protein [Gammaproteobacteria bacterium]
MDEPNGRVAVFLQAGDGYTVGSLAALSADILDDDEPEPQTQQTERQTQASTFVADATLVADIRQWRGETEHGQAHVDRWTRVLIALGVETGALAPMTASEAQGYADKGWTRWERAVAELQRKAAHDAGQTVPTPPPPTPEITISGGAGVTEGGDAEFTLTAAPTPTSEIDVTVTVTETGSFAASGATGTRTVPVGTGGTASFTVATENDATDEADGSIEAAVGSGSGYTVGSAATASVAVSDNDDPPMPEVNITASAGGTEGEAATFTLTATPAPASELVVGVTVAATGDYGVVTGDRNATIPTGGSVSLAVDTTDDSADEPNGTVTLTLNAGSGYTVGALSTGTADILDDDAPPQPQTQASTFVPDAQLVSDIRQWRGETQHGQTHIDRWTRVLIALGAETGALAPMTVSEAQGYADKGWTRWVAVLAELKRKEAHDAQPVTPVTPPPTLPTVTVSGDGAVTEGAGAAFTVSRTGDTAAALTVLLAVSEDASGGRDFVDANDEGDKQVTIGAGSAAAAFTVPTTGDSTDEPDGAVTLALRTSSAYASGSPSSATVAVSDDDDTTGLPRVSIDDAEAQEGQGMVFTVRLSAPATKHAFVYVKTQESSPASATAGVDYQANHFSDPKRVVIIYRGSRERQFSVQTYRDAHDDDGETFEVVVTQAWMNASGGARPLPIADGVSVGTITNDGPLPGAYLARFGRAVAEQALDGIAGRLEADRAPGLRGTFAGLALGFGPASGQPAIGGGPALGMAGPGTPGAWLMPNIAPGFGAQALDPAAGASSASGTFGDRLGAGVPGAPPPRSRAMAAQEALLGSSFTLTRKRDGADGTMAFWGRTSRSRFDGAERGQGNDVALDGTVTTGMLGVDYARGGWLVGLALTRTLSDGRYASVGGGDPCAAFGEEAPAGCGGAQRIGDGDVEASLTAAVPYAAWRASERLKVWGAAGYGAGEVALKTFGGRHGADTSWSMAAAGARGDLLAPRPGGGPALALVSDALWTRTASDGAPGLAASASDVTRLRLGLEGGWRLALPGGGSLMPKLELGARHDGGDAETGFGVELGGGFNWTEPRLGLALDVSGRALLTHEDGDLRDRGFSAALSFDPAPSTGLGPSLSLSQSLGGLARGGLDALFAPGPLERRTGSDANGRWAMEAAYGFPAFGDRFIGSPHVGFGQAAGSRDYSLGWRLAPEAENAPDLSFSLGAMRRKSGAAKPEHGIKADIRLRW